MMTEISAVIDGQPAVLPALSCELPDGRRGWFQRHELDCMEAALATLTGRPYDDVVGINTLRKLEAWAESEGLAVEICPEPPEGPWIGATPIVRNGLRHTIVGLDSGLYFDPASGWEFAGGKPLPPEYIEYFIRIYPKELA